MHTPHYRRFAVKVIIFVIAMVFFVGGILLMGYAFSLTQGMAFMFFGGIISIVISLAIPFHVLGQSTKR
jgi:hypothetical protein